MADSPFFTFFNEHPVFPIIVLTTNTLAFLPTLCLLYIAQIAPLHNNCRYILSIWALSFCGVFVCNASLAAVDLEGETGYMPRSMFLPHIRFELYQWHVMCTTFCSSFEIALSLERMLAIVHPRHYHFSGMAWKTLAILTLFLMVFSYGVDWCVHNEHPLPQLVGCAILGVIEISVLTVNEAYEMSRAMIPAYIISFILKSSAIIAMTVYFALIRDEKGYLTGYVQIFMLTTHVSNGTFSICNLLLKHPQLRKQTNRKFRTFMRMQQYDKRRINSITVNTETYFSIYSASWK